MCGDIQTTISDKMMLRWYHKREVHILNSIIQMESESDIIISEFSQWFSLFPEKWMW